MLWVFTDIIENLIRFGIINFRCWRRLMLHLKWKWISCPNKGSWTETYLGFYGHRWVLSISTLYFFRCPHVTTRPNLTSQPRELLVMTKKVSNSKRVGLFENLFGRKANSRKVYIYHNKTIVLLLTLNSTSLRRDHWRPDRNHTNNETTFFTPFACVFRCFSSISIRFYSRQTIRLIASGSFIARFYNRFYCADKITQTIITAISQNNLSRSTAVDSSERPELYVAWYGDYFFINFLTHTKIKESPSCVKFSNDHKCTR